MAQPLLGMDSRRASRTLATQPPQRIGLRRRQPVLTLATIKLLLLDPLAQRLAADPKLPSDILLPRPDASTQR